MEKALFRVYYVGLMCFIFISNVLGYKIRVSRFLDSGGWRFKRIKLGSSAHNLIRMESYKWVHVISMWRLFWDIASETLGRLRTTRLDKAL